MTLDRPLRIALAGAGQMARQHVQAIQALGPTVQIVGIADPSAEARTAILDEFPDMAEAPTLPELLETTVADVVHVCTPMEFHAEVAMQALDHGCHVYVEKPVTPEVSELTSMLGKAGERGLKVCAGHQVLFERPYRSLLDLLPSIGRPVHVDSYFSFKPVRTSSGRTRPLSNDEQLLDVLPHPTYLLLDVLERTVPEGSSELRALEISQGRTMHALVGRGEVTGCLVASLEARPVEHWLRVVGTNGTLHADFVRGSVQELLGPGTSGIDKALNPLRLSWQLGFRTIGALARRIRKRGGSYPGLEDIFRSFYQSIRDDLPSPTSETQIRETVQICQQVKKRLLHNEEAVSRENPKPAPDPQVLVTGGTGLLGREVVKILREADFGVRVVSRRIPPPEDHVPGVHYVAGDLAGDLPPGLLTGIRKVIHCAAETSGGWDAHQRNSIDATVSLLRASADAGVETFVQVSSVAVLDSRAKGPVTDQTPLHPDPKRLGPYVWGKSESERLVREMAPELGIGLKVVRPVPLIDTNRFSPPGRLGRRISNLFVAVGRPSRSLVVADNKSTARAVVETALRPKATEHVTNLVPPRPPTRGELVERLRRVSPEVWVVWVPPVVLHPLSWTATLAQKLFRPGQPAIDLASAFRGIEYAPGPAAKWMSERHTVNPLATETAHAS